MTFHTDVPQQADIAARLAPIRAHFIGTLAARRDRLAAFCTETDPLPAPEVIRALQEDAHKIRGVALTLGFDRLGHSAAVADELLNPWQRALAPLPVDAQVVDAICDLISQIDAAISQGA